MAKSSQSDADLETAKRSLEDSKEEKNRLSAEIATLAAHLQSSSATSKELENDLSASAKSQKELQSTIDKLIAEVASLQSKISEETARANQYEEQAKDLESALALALDNTETVSTSSKSGPSTIMPVLMKCLFMLSINQCGRFARPRTTSMLYYCPI